jgi:hypothetical protein
MRAGSGVGREGVEGAYAIALVALGNDMTNLTCLLTCSTERPCREYANAKLSASFGMLMSSRVLSSSVISDIGEISPVRSISPSSI